jgi:hypothetical protein
MTQTTVSRIPADGVWRGRVARMQLAVNSMSKGRWSLLAGGMVVGAFVVRIAVIALYQKGGSDLQFFYYFGNLVRLGRNPYSAAPVALGGVDHVTGDVPPFLFGTMSLLLAIHNSRNTLRVASAVVEAATVLVILAFAPRSRAWRLSVSSFVAFNPFTLIAWTAFFEDKAEMFFVLVVMLIALERGNFLISSLMSFVMAAVNWLIVFIPALIVHTYSRFGRRRCIAYTSVFLAVYALSYSLYFPSNLEAYVRRAGAIRQPYHASLDVFLSEAGLYSPMLIKIVVPLSLMLIYLAYFRRLIDVRETIVLTILASFVFLPDHTTHRIALTTLPFLFILRLTPSRMAMIWGAALLGAIADIVARYGVPVVGTSGSIGHAVEEVFGPRLGSPGYAFFANTLTFLMLGLFARDKFRERKGLRLIDRPRLLRRRDLRVSDASPA